MLIGASTSESLQGHGRDARRRNDSGAALYLDEGLCKVFAAERDAVPALLDGRRQHTLHHAKRTVLGAGVREGHFRPATSRRCWRFSGVPVERCFSNLRTDVRFDNVFSDGTITMS
jgi:hypothetical protein